jgi:hypothetical protein
VRRGAEAAVLAVTTSAIPEMFAGPCGAMLMRVVTIVVVTLFIAGGPPAVSA